ncbi:MAG: S41 family peptidase [Bacteroidales bacterium]|jgi:carboxyl-terminal processing protease|nr:S41 family peptidase [Bacteroidales bacterium]
MKNSTKKITVIIISLVITIFISAFSNNYVFSQNYDPNKTGKKLAATMQIIKYYYVDSINEPELVENAIIETLKELDPHSAYISKEDIDKANEPLVGSFEGIGVSFQIFKDTILVIAPVPGGPSDKLGILAGDKIVKIDGEDATGSEINNKYVFEKLRGKKGTKVNVGIYRKGKKDLIDYTITRDKIPINSIDAVFMATPDIGYIKLNRFSKTTMEEFQESLKELEDKGMERLILDLRGNSGGYLNTAVELSDEFLPNNKLVVYTKGLRSPVREYNATLEGSFENGKLVILINEGSASASEIVSGAVQDWDRGIIIGRRSFGKGLVQRPFALPDGSVIRLTTARYYTPTGRSIQRPYESGIEDYYKDLYDRMKNGEMIHPDSIHFPDSLKYFTSKNRLVYGGGGIMPDVFIPWDSTRVSDYYSDLIRNGVLNKFVIQYIDDNRKKLLKKYPDFKTYENNFKVDDKFINNFIEFAEKEDVEKDEEGFKISEVLIKQQIKALIARNLWDLSSYFEIVTKIDDGYLKAVEILEDGALFEELDIGD